MSLTVATLLTGLFLLALGVPLLLVSSRAIAILKALPRSTNAAVFLFGTGAIWFLWNVLHLSAADFGEYRVWLALGFLTIAVLAFKCVPDFLAVRGLCVLMLLAASPLLTAGFMIYDPWTIFLYKIAVYLGISAAIWLGAQPYRLRDFFEWLFARPQRTRGVGAAFAAYGLVLAVVAFTY